MGDKDNPGSGSKLKKTGIEIFKTLLTIPVILLVVYGLWSLISDLKGPPERPVEKGAQEPLLNLKMLKPEDIEGKKPFAVIRFVGLGKGGTIDTEFIEIIDEGGDYIELVAPEGSWPLIKDLSKRMREGKNVKINMPRGIISGSATHGWTLEGIEPYATVKFIKSVHREGVYKQSEFEHKNENSDIYEIILPENGLALMEQLCQREIKYERVEDGNIRLHISKDEFVAIRSGDDIHEYSLRPRQPHEPQPASKKP